MDSDKFPLILNHLLSLRSGNDIGFYSGDTRFKSQPTRRLSPPEIFVVFLLLSIQIPG